MTNLPRLAVVAAFGVLAVGCSTAVGRASEGIADASGGDCGSMLQPDATSPDADASNSPADASEDTPDARTTPDPDVLPAVEDAGDLPKLFRGVVTSTSEIALFYRQSTGERSAVTWEQGRWIPRVIGPAVQGQRTGAYIAGEFDGRPVWIDSEPDTTNPDWLPRYWVQRADGSFSPGVPIPNHRGIVTAGNYDALNKNFMAAGSDLNASAPGGESVYVLERGANGTWSRDYLSAADALGYSSAIATGWKRDGTAFVVVQRQQVHVIDVITVYRCDGATWAKDSDLVQTPENGPEISAAVMAAPPPGGVWASAAYWDGAAVKAFRWNLENGAVSQTVTVSSCERQPILVLATSADGNDARLVVLEALPGYASVSGVQNGAFGAATPLRPDLLFASVPVLVFHPQLGFMIAHQTWRAADPIQTRFESLDAFASGH